MTTLIFDITGPKLPLSPPIVVYSEVSHTSAKISWVISAVSYTPETYFVAFGFSPNNLVFNSSLVDGSTDLTARKKIFSLMLNYLEPSTAYYVSVVAVNSYGSAESSTISFETVPLRKLTYAIVLLNTNHYVLSYAAISVTIETKGSFETGYNLSLSCSASSSDDNFTIHHIEWLGPNDTTVSDGSVTVVENTTASTINFTPLTLKHDGVYKCKTFYNHDNQISFVTYISSVDVQGEYHMYIRHHV